MHPRGGGTGTFGQPADTPGLRCYAPPAPAGPASEASLETAVRVLADDPVSQKAAEAGLSAYRDIRVLTADEAHRARVALILVHLITDEAVALIREAATASPELAGFVLVGEGLREQHLLKAIAHGPLSVIPRRDADFGRIVRALTGVPAGRLELPEEAVGWLAGWLRTIHTNVLEPRGLTAAGLGPREAEVIRLLAEGLDTAEIAQRLNYSERTVKAVIHTLLTRRRLHSRAHVVAFALRSGMV